MSVICEYVLQTTIVRGLRKFKQDPKLIEQLFRNLSQADIARVKNFVLGGTIDICLGYPGDPKMPSINILLKSENEKQAFLGDELETEIPETFEYPGSGGDYLGGVASTTDLSGYAGIVFGPFDVSAATANTLSIATKEWSIDQYAGKNLNVHIIAGTGKGQIRKIDSNNQNMLMITSTWLINPDATSDFEIRKPHDEVVGEPSGLYNSRDSLFVNRRGVLNQANYQLQVIGSTPEQVILITIMLKSIFLLYRNFTESQGLIDLKMAATDFAPKNENSPNIAYMRAINLEFSYHFDIFETLESPDSIRTVFEEMEDGTISIINDSTITI